MLDPIIITGVPRSRTSMTTALLHFCGLQLGEVSGPSSNNKKGQFENREIINKVEKVYLRKFHYDPMGQHPLPEPKKLPIDTSRRQMVLDIAKKQGINTNEKWGFKDSKSILSLYSWLNAFPDSIWVIVNRKKEDIAKSCELTPFMRKRKDWLEFVDDYRYRFNLLKTVHDKVYEVDSDEVVAFNFDKLKFIVKEIGLTWNEDMITEFVDPKLTRL